MEMLLSLLFLLLFGIVLIFLWPLFVLWFVTKIHFAFVYCIYYIYARISYKKNQYTAKENLLELEDELKQMDYEEFRFLLNRCFGTSYTTYYDAVQQEILTWRKKGYKKGLQASIRLK